MLRNMQIDDCPGKDYIESTNLSLNNSIQIHEQTTDAMGNSIKKANK